MDADFKKYMERMMVVKKEFGDEEHKAVALYDDILRYPEAEVVDLFRFQQTIFAEEDSDKRKGMIAEFAAKRAAIKPRADAPERIYLWPEGKMPVLTEYTDNSDYRYNHDPDFLPYMFEILVDNAVNPKGAVICIAGGDHGSSTISEAYQTCRDFNALGYQCFLLHNRVNHNPWSGQECGVDTARAIRMIRRDAAKYRINPNNITVAGFSNGGLTGEACIQYYSGKQTVSDHFPGYVPDELDSFYGAPDAFICVYGPRMKDTKFDYTGVEYPPTFFAVGRGDFAMENLHPTYCSLVEQGIPTEIHTFAATPHGVAGTKLVDGEVKYPNFELWLPLADAFMRDVYAGLE